MDFSPTFSLGRILVVTTSLTLLSFFTLLIITNVTNRRGISELQKYDKEITEYTARLKTIDYTIATYSSLVRVEQRAQDIGFQPTKKIEYVK